MEDTSSSASIWDQLYSITLNKDVCVFTVQSLTFLGHKISNTGISVDLERIKASSYFDPTKKLLFKLMLLVMDWVLA
nr:unnamed protein product [Callosobruchus analis]